VAGAGGAEALLPGRAARPERHRGHQPADPEQRADVDLRRGPTVDEDRDAATVRADPDLQPGDAVLRPRVEDLPRLRPVVAIARSAQHQVPVVVVLAAFLRPG